MNDTMCRTDRAKGVSLRGGAKEDRGVAPSNKGTAGAAQVLAVERLADAVWTDMQARPLPGVGRVRALETCGGRDCAMHAALGDPNESGQFCCGQPRAQMLRGLTLAHAAWRRRGQPEVHCGKVLELLWFLHHIIATIFPLPAARRQFILVAVLASPSSK